MITKDKGGFKVPTRQFRVDQNISAAKVRVLGPRGDNLGILPREEALRKAAEMGANLVEIAPNVTPPVCRIIDFKKFIFEENKREKKQAKAKTNVKQIVLRPSISTYDLGLKIKKAREFLLKNHKVKLSVVFAGKQILYPELGAKKMNEAKEALSDVARVEQDAKRVGRFIHAILVPKN